MDNIYMISYEIILDMISSFQWVPESGSLRLVVGQSVDHAVLKSLNQLAREIACATAGRNTENAQIILEVFSRRPDLLYAGTCGEVIAGANRIVEFVGVGPDLIGVGNLYLTAFALTIRAKVPRRWNDFCHHVDKPDWRVAIQGNSDGVSSSLGTQSAAPSAAVTGYDLAEEIDELPEEDFPPNVSGECAATKASVEKVDEPSQPKRSGLSAAFDNADFNEKADTLLNHYREEDTKARHSVISEPASLPTGCSPYHDLIQGKSSAVRSGIKGGKR